MSLIFLSHSSVDELEAVALKQCEPPRFSWRLFGLS